MPRKIANLSVLDSDLAARHKALRPSAERSSPEIDRDFDTLMRDGYVIIEGVLDRDTLSDIRSRITPLLDKTGRNTFEGARTQRVYDVFSKTRVLDHLADHPRILGLMDKLFLPNYLISQAQIINILPGEAPQLLHADDSFYKVPRPRPPLGAATIWAIDDFTEDNGATVVIPGSHAWGQDRRGRWEEAIPAVIPAGSVLFFLGTTWHGGGENRSDKPRLAVTCQYCEAYLRQQENFLLELSREVVRELSPELRSLIGYSIMPPFMGMVDGKHPLRLLEEE